MAAARFGYLDLLCPDFSAYEMRSQTHLLMDVSQLDPLIPCDLHLFRRRELVAFSVKVFSLSISLIHSDGPLSLGGVLKLTK